MVVRKPTPAGAFVPASSLSRPSPHVSSPPSTSNESPTLPLNATPSSLSDPYRHLRPSPNTRDEVPQPFNRSPGDARHPHVDLEVPAGKPLSLQFHASGASRSEEGFRAEVSNNMRPGLSASGEATPRSSLDSKRSKEFWEDDSQGNGNASNGTKQLQQSLRPDNAPAWAGDSRAASIPPIAPASDLPVLPRSPDIIRSNNPFRRKISNNGHPTNPAHLSDGVISTQDPNEKGYGLNFPPEATVEMTANLSLADRPFSEYSSSYRPSTLNLGSSFQEQDPGKTLPAIPLVEPSEPSTVPPPTPSLESSDEDHQPPLIPLSTEVLGEAGIKGLHSALSNGPSTLAQDSFSTRENVLQTDVAGLEKDLPTLPQPNSPPSSNLQASAELPVTTLSQGTDPQELCPQDHPPSKPSTSRTLLSTTIGVDLARLREQRNETYQIKHFNWFDHNNQTLRRSSMLVQNKNGPCPLLALVNALILGGESDSRSALGAALRTREQVSLGLIIESLIDELTSEGRGGHLTELPDVDELNCFLLMLHTGMTANPRLATPATPSLNLMDARNSSLHLSLPLNNDRRPGMFEDTQEMRLYGAFAIPLIHGWLAPRSDPARAAFARSAPTYEDAQTIQFREEELEDKLSRVGLNPEEQQLLQDISSIGSFLASHPTQITPYGLDIIKEALFPGSFAIIFRNDHFCTIYKHPESGQLFTLVTDAGYSDKDEVIWESLVDVSGQNSEFFSGDFRPVGNADANDQSQQPQSDDSSATHGPLPSGRSQGLASSSSTRKQQQQADADFALALQLQEEEEARMDDSRLRSNVNEPVTNRTSEMNNSHSLRERAGSRPTIPPRNTRNQGVNRPVDTNSEDAPPPAYEEAAKGRPYVPPAGHPQHPSFGGQSPTSGPSTPMHPPGPRMGQPPPRRMSAFQESSQLQSPPPLTRPYTNGSYCATQSSGRPRDKDKDCVVM